MINPKKSKIYLSRLNFLNFFRKFVGNRNLVLGICLGFGAWDSEFVSERFIQIEIDPQFPVPSHGQVDAEI